MTSRAMRTGGGYNKDAVTASRYAPAKGKAYWERLEPVVTEAVTVAARRLEREERSLYPPAAALALWAWQTRGISAEAKKIFRRHLVEEFVHTGMPDFSRSSRATYRSALLAIADAVTPAHEKTLPIPRSEPTSPYTAHEVASLRSWALRQGRPGRRRDAMTLLALGLGAGLATRELLSVRGSDLEWRDGLLHITVWEGRARAVPVVPQWTAPLLERGHDHERDSWVFRPGRQGVRGAQVTDFLHRGQQTDLDVRPARMRTTWLLTHLVGGTAPRELLAIAGLKNLAALDRITRFTPGTSSAAG
ncbi:hypothetical protein R2Q81_10470 [Microbacterium aquimaris]|uniref:hypothetical protein n=1 Tax=Microbacterium aquimaris TaxID=459816 RepID=UPI002AD29DD0|nr:hypothetical protein [Microbacterium aquimaris]MDZ8276369.1 hypothetical protein [Microbacterium aquimaris]